MRFPCGLHLLLAQQTGEFWMPARASTTAGAVDWLFNLILVVSAFFFSLIVVLMLVFVIRYRRRPGIQQKKAPSHSTPLEVTWTLIPVGIVTYLFYAGFTTFMDMKTAPRNSYDVRVVARQWSWLFQYPNGVETNELHVPVERPVLLTMSSLDVIHGLYIPAFRVKMDIVPSRYTQTWFQAVKPGVFDLYCSQYCGTNHSGMITHVVVHPPGEFDAWLDETERQSNNLPPAQAGPGSSSARAARRATPWTARPRSGRRLRAFTARWYGLSAAHPSRPTTTTSASRSSSPTPRSSRASKASACRPSRDSSRNTRSTS